jgi:hypothetical protein
MTTPQTTEPQNGATQKRWLTLEEVRARLEQITQTPTSLDQVYGLTRLRRRGKRLKAFRWGKSKRVTEQSLSEFLQQQEGRL